MKKLIWEGKAKFYVPKESLRRKSLVFYNPEMKFTRDLTISFLQVLNKKEKIVCDPLAGSGVRGIRILKEVSGIKKVVFNDINPNAYKLIKENLKLNKIKKEFYEVYNKDANLLFLENKRKFDYIDIDPFGSPINYLDSVAKSLKPRSFFGCTATDTACLAGSFPKVCLRKYGIKTIKTDFFKEIGLRNLITIIIREFAKYSLSFEPVFSHSNHYFRVLGFVEYGKSRVDKNLEKIKIVSYCLNCLYRSLEIKENCENCGKKLVYLGPIWVGKIFNKDFCKKMLKENDKRGFDTKEIEMIIKEDEEPFYYDLHKICKKLKTAPPKIENLIKRLKENGFKASRTYLFPTGIRTNTNFRELIKLIKSKN